MRRGTAAALPGGVAAVAAALGQSPPRAAVPALPLQSRRHRPLGQNLGYSAPRTCHRGPLPSSPRASPSRLLLRRAPIQRPCLWTDTVSPFRFAEAPFFRFRRALQVRTAWGNTPSCRRDPEILYARGGRKSTSSCVQRGAPPAVRTCMTLETKKRNGETKRKNGVYSEARKAGAGGILDASGKGALRRDD